MKNNLVNVKLNKGYTIVELVVVIAVISVISFMIVTFSLLVSGVSSRTRYTNNMCSDITCAKESFNTFVSCYDDSKYLFSVSDNTIVVKQNGEVINSFYFLNGMVLSSERLNSSNDKLNLELKRVDNITFSNEEEFLVMDIEYMDECESLSCIKIIKLLRASSVEVENE